MRSVRKNSANPSISFRIHSTNHSKLATPHQEYCNAGAYPASFRAVGNGSYMSDIPRITVTELKKRMDAGEEFTLIDVRNPAAWSQSDTALPEAMRISLDAWEQNLARIPKSRPIVSYCT